MKSITFDSEIGIDRFMLKIYQTDGKEHQMNVSLSKKQTVNLLQFLEKILKEDVKS